MEYGYEIIDSAGNKTFFVEGCTYCQMSTGGLHESKCPLYKPTYVVEFQPLVEDIKAIDDPAVFVVYEDE